MFPTLERVSSMTRWRPSTGSCAKRNAARSRRRPSRPADTVRRRTVTVAGGRDRLKMTAVAAAESGAAVARQTVNVVDRRGLAVRIDGDPRRRSTAGNGKEEVKDDEGAATGPARIRADRDRIPDHQRSEASLQKDDLHVVRSTGSDAPVVDLNRSMKEDTPSTAKIAAGMNAATIIVAITATTETAPPAMAPTILAIAVAAATEVACEAAEALVATAGTTEATVVNVATCPHRISTVIRWVARLITIITTRRWSVAYLSITTAFLRWRPDRVDTMRPHRSRRWQRVEQAAASAAPFQADSHHVTVVIRTWATVR